MEITLKKYIDLDAVFKKKNPKLYKFIPFFVLSWLKKLVHQDDLNRDLNILQDYHGVDFFTKFISMMNWTVRVEGEENIPKQGNYIFASNHPLGGPDGIIFIGALSRYYPKVKFLVNDLLMYLPNVEDVFLPVNKLGSNSKNYTKLIDEAFETEGTQILIFPAGLVSRKEKGVIRDLEWRKTFIVKAKKHKRNVVPVYIDGKNSKFFYNFAMLRKKFGIKLNLEMFFLVDELYKHRNKTFVLKIGKPILCDEFDESKKPEVWAQWVKEQVYSLCLKN